MSYPDKDSFDDKPEWPDVLLMILKSVAIVIIAVTVLVYLTGCASDGQMDKAYNAQIETVKAQTVAQPALIKLSCSNESNSCPGLSFEYNPRNKIIVPSVTNQNDVVIKSLGPITTAVGYVSGAVAATRIFSDFADSAGGGNTNIESTSHITGNDNTNNQSVSLSEANGNQENSRDNTVDSYKDSSQQNPIDNSQQNSSVVENNPIDNSNNSDNSDSSNNPIDDNSTTNPIMKEE